MTGFPKDTMTFLKGIGAHNEKAWFEANRPLYEAGYVGPARAFVEEIGPRLQKLAPGIRFEPRIGGSISRINRDIRFSRDKRPYKDHLDLWFWHGEKRGWELPGFYLRITPWEVWLGAGMHMFGKEQLTAFRDAVVAETSGRALVAALGKVEKAGYKAGEANRKQVPRGYDKDHPRARYLLLEGLHAGTELPGADALRDDFSDVVVGHFKAVWPVAEWIEDWVIA